MNQLCAALSEGWDFYPRPPGGGRRRRRGLVRYNVDFYPRPPGGGRRRLRDPDKADDGISIHALRVEGDPLSLCIIDGYKISIHALRVEGD